MRIHTLYPCLIGALVMTFISLAYAQAQTSAHTPGAQTSEVSHRSGEQAIKPSTAGGGPQSPVLGGGTLGQLTKWIGFGGSNSVIGDSIISETKYGNVGVGTTNPGSKLTVVGMIETTLGGVKFPDGTLQSTAGLASLFHDPSLMGNGTSGSPLGIAAQGVGTIHLADGAVTGVKIASGTVVRSLDGLFDNVSLGAGSNITITPLGNTLTIAANGVLNSVAHDATLAGTGAAGSPLGIATPLSLSASVSNSFTLSVLNTAELGSAIQAQCADSAGYLRDAIQAIAGSHTGNFGADGGRAVFAIGGASETGTGGQGVYAGGGNSLSFGNGGEGMIALGGNAQQGGGAEVYWPKVARGPMAMERPEISLEMWTWLATSQRPAAHSKSIIRWIRVTNTSITRLSNHPT